LPPDGLHQLQVLFLRLLSNKMKALKIILAFSLLTSRYNAFSQQPKLLKIWETDSIINLPESVLPDSELKVLFVSQMGNNANDKDGIGGIAKLDFNGKLIDLNWITGLNSPKGLARFGNKLYVADLTDVVIIDIKKGKVDRKIAIDSALFLNDITVSKNGIVYVSDSKTKKIHKIQNDKQTVFLRNVSGVNGLKAMDADLFIAGGKMLWKATTQKQLIKIAELPQGGDGIEPVGNGDFLFSSWGGYLFYIYSDGKSEVLVDTHLQKINCADIGYDPNTKTVYIPTFWKKSVAAYRLQY
jgi:hypothetical protein